VKHDLATRDAVMTDYRWAIADKLGFVPFVHQADWWLATDGLLVTDQPARAQDPGVRVLIRADVMAESDVVLDERIIKGARCVVVRRRTLPRPQGRARVCADLGSFKIGKSHSAAIWAAGFAAIPGARVKLVGYEYDTCAPEFEYIVEAICSDRGMGTTPASLQNRPRDGRMWLDLPNGARFEARSWERKDGLKGKEDDCYVFCEAYQLPGIECYTDFKQNLDARKGYAIFPTTPDRPWVEIFHQHGHGDPEFPDWQCVCGVARDVNPTSFDASQKEKDRKLMTREKFGIHYEGQIGRYIGSVFNYQRGQRQFTTATHPDCWRDVDKGSVIENFQIPPHWETFGAADTGTFTAGLLAALSPTGDLLFVYEQPNYRYIGGKHEFLDGASIATWKRDMRRAMDAARVRDLRADPNSQWKRELLSEPNGIHLRAGTADLEQRTEVLREYFQHGKVFLAPWLEVLPYELEQAQWPDDTTAGGRYRRVKKQDHTLDGAEHIAACRPRSVLVAERKPKLWIEEFTGHALTSTPTANPHMGIH
jgi:hypothetical protein